MGNWKLVKVENWKDGKLENWKSGKLEAGRPGNRKSGKMENHGVQPQPLNSATTHHLTISELSQHMRARKLEKSKTGKLGMWRMENWKSGRLQNWCIGKVGNCKSVAVEN